MYHLVVVLWICIGSAFSIFAGVVLWSIHKDRKAEQKFNKKISPVTDKGNSMRERLSSRNSIKVLSKKEPKTFDEQTLEDLEKA